MARLDSPTKAEWKNALVQCRAKWVLFGIDSAKDLPERLSGMSGLIDWFLHGQVSRLISTLSLDVEELCLLPGNPGLQRPNFILYQFSASPDLKKLLGQLAALQITELALSDSTFPEDFCGKLKQNLKKQGIRWNRLESNNDDSGAGLISSGPQAK
jgi:hypothetical protein